MSETNPMEEAMAERHSLEHHRHASVDPRAAAAEGPAAIYELVKTRGLRLIDFWFTELGGRPWRLSMSAESLNDAVFTNGIVVDGRQVGGTWEGLIAIMPDPAAFFLDPTVAVPTLSVMCDIVKASRADYLEDSRSVLKRAEEHFRRCQIGSTWNVGAEVEFFMLDENGRPVATNLLRETLRELWATLDGAKIQVDWFRTGPAAGQGRVQMRSAPALRTADQVVVYKNAARSIASRRGCVIKFVPKPVAAEGSAGLLVHHAIWRDGINRFHDPDGWAFTSPLCRSFAAGLLAHGPALLAFCAPTMNSYRRLIPGASGPTDLVLSNSLSTAACRVPAGTTGPAPAARRVKFCAADPSANPYLALAAMMMAGLDGIERKLEPPIDAIDPSRRTPHCLEDALDALKTDRAFLTREGVFPNALVEGWIFNRWKEQVLPVRAVPHPVELQVDAYEG
ncbi:MAG: glutamine synthetase [Elusimicrobia bacterium]|nr:glutamine synthetase [Elusimicrobiota bacterium]